MHFVLDCGASSICFRYTDLPCSFNFLQRRYYEIRDLIDISNTRQIDDTYDELKTN